MATTGSASVSRLCPRSRRGPERHLLAPGWDRACRRGPIGVGGGRRACRTRRLGAWRARRRSRRSSQLAQGNLVTVISFCHLQRAPAHAGWHPSRLRKQDTGDDRARCRGGGVGPRPRWPGTGTAPTCLDRQAETRRRWRSVSVQPLHPRSVVGADSEAAVEADHGRWTEVAIRSPILTDPMCRAGFPEAARPVRCATARPCAGYHTPPGDAQLRPRAAPAGARLLGLEGRRPPGTAVLGLPLSADCPGGRGHPM